MFDDVTSIQFSPPRAASSWKAALSATLAGSLLVLSGCSVSGTPGAPTATTSSVASDSVHADDIAVMEEEDLEAAMEHIATDVGEEFGATISLAIVDDKKDFLAGDDGSEPAWSTIKVPIAIAALRDGADEELVDAAIKESDNDAARALWNKVEWTEGNAQESIETLLKDFDSEVEMNDAFGMSTWKVKDQARFASRLGCVPEADYVYDAMRDIVDWQKWGLAGLEDVHSKGGWGLDDEDGEYTSRQIGVMPVDGGNIGIAISASWNTWEDDSEFLDDTDYDAVEDVSAAALDEVASRLEALIAHALETGELTAVDDCVGTSTSETTPEDSKENSSESSPNEETEDPSEEPSEAREDG